MLVRPVTGYLPPIRAVARRPWRAVGRLRERAWQPAVGRLAARAVGPRCVPVPHSAVRGGRVGRGVREGGVAPNGRGPSPVSRPRSGGRAWACALGGARTLLHPGPRCCGPGVAPGRVWPASPCLSLRLCRRLAAAPPAAPPGAGRPLSCRAAAARHRPLWPAASLSARGHARRARSQTTHPPPAAPSSPWWRRRRLCTCTRSPALPCRRPCVRRCSRLPRRPVSDGGGGATRVYTPRR